jgi:hypothetical protein
MLNAEINIKQSKSKRLLPRVSLHLFQQQSNLVLIKIPYPVLMMRIAPLVRLLHIVHVEETMIQLHHGRNDKRLIQNKFNSLCRRLIMHKQHHRTFNMDNFAFKHVSCWPYCVV